MTKNPIKFVRNPNSSEAIQARLDGYTDPTNYESTHYILDNEANHIFIDLTEDIAHQRINYSLFGGHKTHMNKKLVRTSLHTNKEGRTIITNYYTDVRNRQWIIIKSFLNKDLPRAPSANPTHPHPRPTFGNTYGGFFASARGETWRHEGKSVDKLREAQRRIRNRVDINSDADLVKDRPLDHFEDEFTGQK